MAIKRARRDAERATGGILDPNARKGLPSAQSFINSARKLAGEDMESDNSTLLVDPSPKPRSRPRRRMQLVATGDGPALPDGDDGGRGMPHRPSREQKGVFSPITHQRSVRFGAT